MKKTVSKEVVICDFCNAEQNYSAYKCLGCGKDICYECKKTLAVEYPYSVQCSGSNDGTYCIPCNFRISNSPDALFAAYLKVSRLRAEAKLFYEDFEERAKSADEAVQREAKR